MSSTYRVPDGGGPEAGGGGPDLRKTYVRKGGATRTRLIGVSDSGKGEAADEDPVSGWLVVIRGPGKGEVLTLGYGVHTVGRETGNRLQLDFGDDAVSGQDHFRIIYDPKATAFYAVLGTGKNLIEVDGQTLLDRTPLQPASQLFVGETVLRFTPFCTPEFNWSKTED